MTHDNRSQKLCTLRQTLIIPGKFLEVWPRLRLAGTTKRPVYQTDSTVYLGSVCVTLHTKLNRASTDSKHGYAHTRAAHDGMS